MKRMTQLHAKRLAKLAIFLAAVPENKFDIESWMDHHSGPSVNHTDDELDAHDQEVFGLANAKSGRHLVKVAAAQIEHTCGTTACALGWAGSIPEFQKAGLRLIAPVDVSVCKIGYEVLYREAQLQWSYVEYKTPDMPRGKRHFAAGAAFFGLTPSQSRALFNPGSYGDYEEEEERVLPVDVTNKIEGILRDEGYPALANKVAKCPRFRPWKNQYGRGMSLR